MTIWRQKKSIGQSGSETEAFDHFSVDPFQRDDDASLVFDFHRRQSTTDFFGKPSEMTRGNSKTAKKQLRQLAVGTLLAASAASLGFVAAKTRPWTYWSEQEMVYAYFEMRAVDQSGRPVAGAVVKNAGKKVGTTDSFGEWRRYMRVPLGSTVPVTIAKNNHGEILYATKNFAVPPEKSEKNDMELRASVQMLKAQNATASLSGNQTSSDQIVSKNLAVESAKVVQPPVATVETKNSLENAESVPTEIKPATAHSFVSSHESIWFEAMGSQSSSIAKEILPALVSRAKELGLKIEPEASWKVRLTSLLDRPAVLGADGGGLILVSSFDKLQPSTREFLRNYQSDARLTARGILFILSHQVPKNIAVIPSGERWAAALPQKSAEFWKLAAGMSFVSAQGKVWMASADPYSNHDMVGFYLQPQGVEGPCSGQEQPCELSVRSFVDVPPVPHWTRLRAKVANPLRDQIKIFVSGYEAKPISDNVIEYWGQDHARVNVTVVQAGKVLQRQQIVNDSRAPAVIAATASGAIRR